MPPLWFIVSAIAILGFISLADRLVLRARARIVIVDGREVLTRRKRDSYFLNASIMALFITVIGIGSTIEQDVWVLLPAVVFVGFMVWSLWQGSRMDDDTQVSPAEIRKGKAVTREAWMLISVVGLQIVLQAAADVSSGTLSAVLWVAHSAAILIVFLLIWRFWRKWRAADSRSTSS